MKGEGSTVYTTNGPSELHQLFISSSMNTEKIKNVYAMNGTLNPRNFNQVESGSIIIDKKLFIREMLYMQKTYALRMFFISSLPQMFFVKS